MPVFESGSQPILRRLQESAPQPRTRRDIGAGQSRRDGLATRSTTVRMDAALQGRGSGAFQKFRNVDVRVRGFVPLYLLDRVVLFEIVARAEQLHIGSGYRPPSASRRQLIPPCGGSTTTFRDPRNSRRKTGTIPSP
jgi:hypothetical protein